MHYSLFTTLALLASSGLAYPGLAERAASSCTSNVCASALATQTVSAKSDCSSFLATTVTPCPKTVKSTVTLTSTIGCAFTSAPASPSSSPATTAVCPVTKSASAVPAYATAACSDGAAFSAACGCINVRPSHTTLPASTVTVTTYKTVKASPTFVAKATSGSYKGYYVSYDGSPEFRSTNIADASYYFVNANGTVLGGNGTRAWYNSASNCHGCYDVTYESELDGSTPTVSCKLGSTPQADGSLSFTCKTSNGATNFQTCSPDGNNLDMGGTPEASFFDCFTLKMGAYPVCS